MRAFIVSISILFAGCHSQGDGRLADLGCPIAESCLCEDSTVATLRACGDFSAIACTTLCDEHGGLGLCPANIPSPPPYQCVVVDGDAGAQCDCDLDCACADGTTSTLSCCTDLELPSCTAQCTGHGGVADML